MIENIIGNNLNIIVKKRHRENGIKVMKYLLNEKIITDFYFLSIRNSNYNNCDYNYNLLKNFNIDKPKNFQNYSFGYN